MQNMTYHTYTLQKLAEEPLDGVTSQLRSALDPKTSNLGCHTRALAIFLNRTPDKNIISFTATLDLSADIMFSSWAKLDRYELDFNLGLGKPEAVRRPQFEPVESLIYLMPRTLDGEIAVATCLRDGDMERLRADEEFAKYGRYIG
jgi:trichothecene 3-O-acetyltransferase